MDKSVTFSSTSTSYEGVEATETFTLKELGIVEELEDDALKKEMERVFQEWVWEKLNISCSIVIE